MNRILIADDDPVSRSMLSHLASGWGYEVITAGDGIEALNILSSKTGPRLAILDWVMPEMDGPEICKRIRLENSTYTYILLLTARTDKEDILSGLAAGADDYLTKPVSAAELKARLGVGRRIMDLQERLAQSYEQAKFDAAHDQLTGLLNRAAILQQLHAEWERSRRGDTSVTVCLADIDHFKKVNDRYGHLIGDAVLREVATRMKGCLRPYDSLGRYGGEEFLLIVPNCDKADGLIVGERMRSAVFDTSINVPAKIQELRVSISVGIAATNARHYTHSCPDEMTILQMADAALYAAKRNGRNRAEVSSPV